MSNSIKYISEKLNNKNLDENYIKSLINIYDLNHNKSDSIFYNLFFIVLFLQNYYKYLSLPYISQTFKKKN